MMRYGKCQNRSRKRPFRKVPHLSLKDTIRAIANDVHVAKRRFVSRFSLVSLANRTRAYSKLLFLFVCVCFLLLFLFVCVCFLLLFLFVCVCFLFCSDRTEGAQTRPRWRKQDAFAAQNEGSQAWTSIWCQFVRVHSLQLFHSWLNPPGAHLCPTHIL